MKTFEVWFDKLEPGRQKVLCEDRWMLARAAWNAALQEAQLALMDKGIAAHERGDYAERDRLQSAASTLSSLR